jgi:hypothetical protein
MFAKYLQEELETETELQKLINKYIKWKRENYGKY